MISSFLMMKAREILVASPRSPLNFDCLDHCCQGFYSAGDQVRHSAFSALYLATHPEADKLFAIARVHRESTTRYNLDYAIERDSTVFVSGKNKIISGLENLVPCQDFKAILNIGPRYQATYRDGLFVLGIVHRIFPNKNSIAVFNKAICFLEDLQKKTHEAVQ